MENKKSIKFPKDFLWGTAVCSHQAEGHNIHSDWWEWEQEGKIEDGTVSGAAADMLNRYPEDFAFMKDLGLNAFRMSVEWARIEPERGKYSKDALDHYERVFKELKKNNMKICLTLYHWVLPKWVADRGGWTNPESVRWFREFVRHVVYRFFDYVDLWCTLNEPSAPILAGYIGGLFPPEKKNPIEAAIAYKNLLRAHSEAARLINEASVLRGAGTPLIGIAMALADIEPKNPGSVIDTKLHDVMRLIHNRLFLDAIKTGTPFPGGREIPGLKGSFTYIGVNYYTRFRLDIVPPRVYSRVEDLLYLPDGTETTEMGYEVYPPGFYDVFKEMSRYEVPMYVTENGIADSTDEKRPGYLLRHLAQMHRAIEDGMDIRGYFQWTYIDNFEWRYGFSKKFGIVALEPDTLNRLPRRSAYMYGRIASAGEITKELVREYAPQAESEIWGCA